jgi:hypothetical protein
MDNLDVGRMRIPITVGKFEAPVLRFTAETVDGASTGRINGNARKIDGTWSMGGDSCPLVLQRVKPSELDGIWAGTLVYQQFQLRLVFHIAGGPDHMIAAMKNRDQGDGMVPMSSANRVGSTAPAMVLPVSPVKSMAPSFVIKSVVTPVLLVGDRRSRLGDCPI